MSPLKVHRAIEGERSEKGNLFIVREVGSGERIL